MSTASARGNEHGELLSLAGMRQAVAALIGASSAELGADDDLIGAGIDSIGIMQMANAFRANGLEVVTADLMEAPTLSAWLGLAQQAAAIAPPTAPVSGQAGNITEPFSLSPMQHAYWVGRIGGHPLSAPSHFYWELAGTSIDPERLERAACQLVDRHPMLRARFLDDGRQQVMPNSSWPGVTVHHLHDDDALRAIRVRESNRRLAVDDGEVFDIQLSQLDDGRNFVHLNIDMLVADAASFRIFLDELAQLYTDPDAKLPPLGYDISRYHDDVERQRAEALPAAAEYWQKRLESLPGPPELPLAVDPAALDNPQVTKREHWLPAAEVRVLRDRGREYGLTASMTLATAFAEAIGRWCAEPRFLLNLPLFDRQAVHPDVPGLMGDFTNLLLLAIDRTGDMSFLERARCVQSQFREDVRYTDYSGTNVLRDLARGSAGTLPTAPVVFTSVLGMGDIVGSRVRSTFGEMSFLSSQTPQVWLDHQVIECDGQLLLHWDAVDSLFPEGCLDAMFEAYVSLVRWLVAPGSRWDTPAPSALPGSQAAVREHVNDTAAEVSKARLQDAFLEQARQRPGALAIAWGEDGAMTYGALSENAHQLAARLQALGAGKEPVAISIPRGPRQIIAVLGALLAGTSYVPIGIDVPTARRDAILATAGVSLLVCADDAAPKALPAGVRPVAIGGTVPPCGDVIASDATDADVAYIIFTSGSTGKPKGVVVPHAAAVNTIDALNDRAGVGPSDRMLAVSALDFDLSVYDIFGVLSAGGAVVLVEESAHGNPSQWASLIRRWQVTLWDSVPTLLEMLLAAGGELGNSLRLALVGGDWPALDLQPKLAARVPGCRLVASGGATEAAIYSFWFDVTRVLPQWRSVPLGTPLRNVVCRVVDRRGQDCPDWVPGELWIGGHSLAAGYRGDPERTAAQFVVSRGTRWYRTGDIACYQPDGNLEFLGRRDHQLKVRGHRIELGDIEAAFRRCANVRQAVAVGLGDPRSRRLAVAVTVDPGAPDDAGEALRAQVAADLPSYMVPENVAVLAALPLSANGKVDRAALGRALAGPATRGGHSEPPSGPTEQALAKIWRGLLGVAPGRRQSFFALGGDSLSATKFVREARRTLGAEIPMHQLFETPTIAELAVAVGNAAEPFAGSELVEEGRV